MSTRETIKLLARATASIAVLPVVASFKMRALIMGSNRALEGSSQTLSLAPGLLGQYIRRAFLCQVLEHCHHTATIEFGVLFSHAGARLDENVYVGPRCHIGWAHLERNVLLGAAVHVPSGGETHGTADLSRPIREQPGVPRPVTIGAGCWVGSGAIILADVGDDSVIGAGAVVTKPLPRGVVAAGVPAKVVRERASARPLAG